MQLIHGDCLNEIPKIPAGTVDLVLADPPYGMNYTPLTNVTTRPKFGKIANDNRPFIWWIHHAAIALKDGGCLISFCRFDSWQFFAQACELAGLKVKAEIVWDKKQHTMGDCTGSPGFRHEIAVFATKGRFKFHGKRPQSLISITRLHSSLMQHPTEKPVQLMEWLVEHYCPIFGTVLDPFMGVAPVGAACKTLQRYYIGIEVEKRYFDIASMRLCD